MRLRNISLLILDIYKELPWLAVPCCVFREDEMETTKARNAAVPGSKGYKIIDKGL